MALTFHRNFIIIFNLFIANHVLAATGWQKTSEESSFTDVTCDSGYAATGAWCTGSNCDNVWLYCGYVGGTWVSNKWTGGKNFPAIEDSKTRFGKPSFFTNREALTVELEYTGEERPRINALSRTRALSRF